jgi:hypothetical protein
MPSFLANTPRNASVPQRNGETILIFLIVSGSIWTGTKIPPSQARITTVTDPKVAA